MCSQIVAFFLQVCYPKQKTVCSTISNKHFPAFEYLYGVFPFDCRLDKTRQPFSKVMVNIFIFSKQYVDNNQLQRKWMWSVLSSPPKS